MKNKTTKAFQSMMLSGRMNKIMSEAVAEGVAETAKAHASKFVFPTYFTPANPPRVIQTEAELGTEFAIPEHVLKAAEGKKIDSK
ncbi:hypothetical protein LGR64_13790 [Delftia sp. Lp-1]|uniref:hypothetical protein n=1 Tax=Delftia sp. Lp-1 TaxID=682863 RepID=UPI001E2930FB|nr:hypothetical protein [Delftia sp. Lp-1]MCB4787348.1 hypothetical protein [Delftia sp. Lp-1]